MLVSFAIALCALVIVLYVQARLAAREIRRNRAHSPARPVRDLVLKGRVRVHPDQLG